MKPLQHPAGLVERFFGKLADFSVDHPRVVVVLLFVVFVVGVTVAKHYDLLYQFLVAEIVG
jgi:hypothetical protein